jgi:hypothetical protein
MECIAPHIDLRMHTEIDWTLLGIGRLSSEASIIPLPYAPTTERQLRRAEDTHIQNCTTQCSLLLLRVRHKPP